VGRTPRRKREVGDRTVVANEIRWPPVVRFDSKYDLRMLSLGREFPGIAEKILRRMTRSPQKQMGRAFVRLGVQEVFSCSLHRAQRQLLRGFDEEAQRR
jgi:hypothetical protein